MTALRIRPNNDFLYTANWQEIYTLTKHWKSDIEFYAYELNFLKNLTNTYFIWLNEDKNIIKVEKLIKTLKDLDKECNSLLEGIQKHLEHISALLENAFIYDEHTFRDEHAVLEEKLVTFNKTFKEVKKLVFESTEEVLNSEKLHYLMEKG